jgi:cytochrome d ubiquinol oxidase subunit I
VSLLTLSRWQFAITVMFHMTFPAITVGISLLLYGMYWTGKPVYLQMFRFWPRIFAVGFAIGVVAGTVITFEFGLDWACSRRRPGRWPSPPGQRSSGRGSCGEGQAVTGEVG